MTFTLTYWRAYLREGTFYDSSDGFYKKNYYPFGSDSFPIFPPALDTVYPLLPIARLVAPPGWIEPPVISPPTPPSTSGTGEVITATAISTINGDKVVALRPTGASMAILAVDAFVVIGISLNSALVGESLQIRTEGEMSDTNWTWTPNAPIFLSLAAGELTQLVPASVNSVQVATAITAQKIWVRIEPPIKLI